MIETPERIVFQLLLNATSNEHAVKETDEKVTKPHKTSDGRRIDLKSKVSSSGTTSRRLLLSN